MANRWVLLLIPLAYLVGSIPFGLMVGKSRGIDPRTAGSGNIGATNLGRLLGKKFFALVFTLDLLKGMLPVLVAGALLGFAPHDWRDYLAWLLVGAAAIIGHMFSVFLAFKGGKGVATSAGVILGVFPYYTLPGLLAVAVWGIVFKTTRYVSVASMLGAVFFPVAYAGFALGTSGGGFPHEQWPLLTFAILMPAMIVYKHRGNIARLRAGTEGRFAKRT